MLDEGDYLSGCRHLVKNRLKRSPTMRVTLRNSRLFRSFSLTERILNDLSDDQYHGLRETIDAEFGRWKRRGNQTLPLDSPCLKR